MSGPYGMIVRASIQCDDVFHNKLRFDRYSTMNKYKNEPNATRFYGQANNNGHFYLVFQKDK